MTIDSISHPLTATQSLEDSAAWSYDKAFCRNRGLINSAEQEKLRNSRVAVAGLGGVGGVDLVTLARIGIGRFTIADPDTFELANTNRQYGATQSAMQRSKAEVMAQIVRDINPEADIRVFKEPISTRNAEDFLADADILVDGIEAFEIEVRRLLFGLAARKGIYGLGAGPVGFSTVWVIFDPQGMSFDRYFGFSDDMDSMEQFVAYIIGMAPRATHVSYTDLSSLNCQARTGPSLSLACQLAAGVVGAEVVKILLKRGALRPAPYYHQFDPYVGRYVRGRLLVSGKHHPWQRVKRWWLNRYLRRISG
jgi:molybdopterin/thiamine biosynthesis adenylyltransferase